MANMMRVAMPLVLCAIALASIANVADARRQPPEGPDHFAFYIHNQIYNPAVNNSVFNAVYSAGPFNFSQPNPYSFGVRATFEANITMGPLPNSTHIGVAQGIWIINSQHKFVLFHIFTATITDGPHKGTLVILGQEDETIATRHLAVVGGTGDFLAARGRAVSTLTFIDHVPPAHWTLLFDLDLYY